MADTSVEEDPTLDTGIILCWNRDNPNAWPDDAYDKARTTCIEEGSVEDTWSVGRRVNIPYGTQCFLLTQGQQHPRGLVGYGVVTGEPIPAAHYDDPAQTTNYVRVLWLNLRPTDDVLPIEDLEEVAPTVPWRKGIRGSGFPLDPEVTEALFTEYLATGPEAEERLPGELDPGEYWEGAVRTITVNRYERDPNARAACLEHHGYVCKACSADLTETYGEELGRRAIHVHHVVPMAAQGGKEYRLDPINDLVPLCPNCHNVIHKTEPVLTPEEFKNQVLRR